MTVWLRALAIALPVMAIADPKVEVERPRPAPVSLQFDANDSYAIAAVRKLRDLLEDAVSFTEAEQPSAIVFIGESTSPESISGAAPVSVVTLASSPNVAIVGAPDSILLTAGSSVGVPVELEGRETAGVTSTVMVEHRNIELARVEHKWAVERRVTVQVPYVGLAPGVSHLKIRVLPLAGEQRTSDNEASVRAVTIDRTQRIAFIESRPSWPVTFVRRALESHPAFSVSSLVRISPGISVRGGASSLQLTPNELTAFDVVVVGAPEELRAHEVRALGDFAARRGGTVVLVPDRRPFGVFLDLLPGRLSERLLPEPLPLHPVGLRVGEVLVMKDAPTVVALARLEGGDPVIAQWPVGDGQIIFSGALDSWRYRGDQQSPFTRFWLETLMAAAAAASPRIDVSLEPGVVRAGERSRLKVRLRGTEFSQRRGLMQFPFVAADVVASEVRSQSRTQMVRLWPTIEPGVFEGEIAVPDEGRYDVRVSTDNRASTSTTLVVDSSAAPRVRPSVLESIPEVTGGVTVDTHNLEPLRQHLRALPRTTHRVAVHPLRSAWWMIPFALALCTEWALRRRSGSR